MGKQLFISILNLNNFVRLCNHDYYRSEEGLRSLIQKKNMDRAASANNLFSALEAKYGGKASKKRSTSKRKEKNESDDDEEDEEALPVKSKKGRVSKK